MFPVQRLSKADPICLEPLSELGRLFPRSATLYFPSDSLKLRRSTVPLTNTGSRKYSVHSLCKDTLSMEAVKAATGVIGNLTRISIRKIVETLSSCQIFCVPRLVLPFLSHLCVAQKSASVWKSTLVSCKQAMVFPSQLHTNSRNLQ